ncbi:hypothetical protein B0H14DRAFT_2826350 [Mycena olivaceomarginata]|nr:hypothetical protein B0H14DRAFT_2826350 [Mycena olivaceomarginata]
MASSLRLPAPLAALLLLVCTLRVDIEIIDSSPEKRVYLSKRDIKGETRLAVGVCFKNYLHKATKMSRIIDLDVDIGAEAVEIARTLIISGVVNGC